MEHESKEEKEVVAVKSDRPPMPKLTLTNKADMDKVAQAVENKLEDKSSNPVGRPPSIDEVTLSKLEMAFKVGCSDEEACFYADISARTLYRYQVENEEFCQQKVLWKKRPVLKARQVVVQAIENDDLPTAKWYLEKHGESEFGDKMKVEHSGSISANYPEDEDFRMQLKEGIKANIKKRWEKKDEDKK